MAEPLANGQNCLEFSGEADLIVAIEKALTMSDQEIEKMRGAVWDYYGRFLDTKSIGMVHGETGRILVNAEEKSVLLAGEFHVPALAFAEKGVNRPKYNLLLLYTICE